MGEALDRFLDAWRGHAPTNPFHPMDGDTLDRLRLRRTFKPLAPYPYSGDLRTAKVWILMRNPGVGESDNRQEAEPPLSDLIARNLRQEFGEFPFLHLSPEVEGTDASDHWLVRANFASLSLHVAQRMGCSERDARKKLATRVAVLNLCAYRSKSFPARAAELPSSLLAREALVEAIDQARLVNNRSFIAPWDLKHWRLENDRQAVIHNSTAQRFSFERDAKCGFGDAVFDRMLGLAQRPGFVPRSGPSF